MTIARLIDKSSGARIGAILGIGTFTPCEKLEDAWIFRAWRGDDNSQFLHEPYDAGFPRAHRRDVTVEVRHAENPLPEIFVEQRHLRFFKTHPMFRPI